MPPPAGTDFVTSLKINQIHKDILDVRTIPGELKFLARTNQVNTPNQMMKARWKGNLQIADLIAPNAPGVAYQASRIYTEATGTQQMKIGTVWTADQVEEYYTLRDSIQSDPDGIFATGLFRQTAMNHIVGTEWRKEWMLVARATDGYYGTSNYNRLGFSLTSPDGRTPSWGMKPDMKSFVSTPLGNPDGSVNAACPIITYIYNMIETRRRRYGRMTNRLTMATATKRAIQKTDEFKALAKYAQSPFVTFNNISSADYPRLDMLLKEVLSGSNKDMDLEVETYDAVYQTSNGDGNPAVYVPFLPLAPEACIILDDKRSDRNNAVQYMAVGTTLESRAEPLRNSTGVPDSLPPGRFGAFSWLDMPRDMDPVRFSLWTTERAWPMKNDEVFESCLFVGPLTDPVPLTDIAIV